MGRELRRVALDFNWPLEKVWDGFVNPHYDKTDCEYCGGRGESPQSKLLHDKWYGYTVFVPEDNGSTSFAWDHPAILAFARRNITNDSSGYYSNLYGGNILVALEREANRLAELFNSQWSHHLTQDDVNSLVEANRLMDFTHTWTRETGWVKKDPPYIPTVEEVNVWSLSGIGHDCINSWVVIEARLKRAGHPTMCMHCNGEGSTWNSEEAKKAHDEWKPTDPPSGEGWQVWETVTEGSPITPVFDSRGALILHLVEELNWSYDGAVQFCGDDIEGEEGRGWAPSFMIDTGTGKTYDATTGFPED